MCSPVVFCEVEDILNEAAEKNEKPFIVVMDEITDAHNAGAIIRSAYCAGAHGVVISKRKKRAHQRGALAKLRRAAWNTSKSPRSPTLPRQ